MIIIIKKEHKFNLQASKKTNIEKPIMTNKNYQKVNINITCLILKNLLLMEDQGRIVLVIDMNLISFIMNYEG